MGSYIVTIEKGKRPRVTTTTGKYSRVLTEMLEIAFERCDDMMSWDFNLMGPKKHITVHGAMMVGRAMVLARDMWALKEVWHMDDRELFTFQKSIMAELKEQHKKEPPEVDKGNNGT